MLSRTKITLSCKIFFKLLGITYSSLKRKDFILGTLFGLLQEFNLCNDDCDCIHKFETFWTENRNFLKIKEKSLSNVKAVQDSGFSSAPCWIAWLCDRQSSIFLTYFFS